ncbi:hypothetical protein PA7_33340 [Pseudonocardia asaccharolytica DSM 44247 = NBRC 16224]|uniref:Uncharacterized protein n=1 Tax=Pseudonocardia asaccharolytica DSM 44247 = NBRC 16224 TaxID=1123024 RepID=A0A511D4A8_9PSEU|nr:hypothetical protein PA7_33340 [Pseudonocardia asaccharolytica DSM 44247 = NBRC 16224]
MMATRPPMVANQSQAGTVMRWASGVSGSVKQPEVSPVDPLCASVATDGTGLPNRCRPGSVLTMPPRAGYSPAVQSPSLHPGAGNPPPRVVEVSGRGAP